MAYIPEEFMADPIISTVARNNQLLPYEVVEKSEEWISKGLRSELDTWGYFPSGIVTSINPIFITAATGAGKTRFVTKKLTHVAKKLNRRVLLLNNRRTLNFQQKIDQSTEKGIGIGSAMVDDLKEIDNLLCYTYHDAYQNLPLIMQGPRIEFVVFDEVHFFTADSTFNPETSRILQTLMQSFKGNRRIYMTATPEEIKPIIALEEHRLSAEVASLNNYTEQLQWSGITEYKFPIDYRSRVQLHFFDGASGKESSANVWPDIVEAIKSDQTDQKWLIFVNDKAFGGKLQKALKGVPVKRIDASHRENRRTEIMDMAREAMFQEKVLITTSFLYNGISFHDPQLQHIVTDYADQESVIQALGRKRIDSDRKEKVNLYIKLQSDDDLKNYRNEINTLFKLTQYFLQHQSSFINQNWDNLSFRQRQLFGPVFWNPGNFTRDIQFRLAQIQQIMQNEGRDKQSNKTPPDEKKDLESFLNLYTAVLGKYPHIFYGEYFRNVQFIMSDYAPYHLGKLAGSYEKILNQFAQGDENAFQKEVCSWFGFDYEETMEFAQLKRQERLTACFNKLKPEVIACIEKYRKMSPMDGETLRNFENELIGIIGDSGNIVKFRHESGKEGQNIRTSANVKAVLEKFCPSLRCKKENNRFQLIPTENNR